MNTVTKLAIIKEIKSILKANEIKYKINLKSHQCYSHPSEKFIYLGFASPEYKSRNAMLSALFHELGHIVNYQTKKYFLYHQTEILNKKSVKYAIQYGLRAEQHTDLIGQKLMKKYDPSSRFHQTYNKNKMKKRYKEEYLTKLISLI